MITLYTTINNDLPVIVQATIIEAEPNVGIKAGYEFEVYFPDSPSEISHSRISESDLERITQELENMRNGE